MNINEITSVQSLIEFNNQASDKVTVDNVFELIVELEASEALEVAARIVGQLASWHQSVAAETSAEDGCAAWAADEGRLHIALLALGEVKL